MKGLQTKRQPQRCERCQVEVRSTHRTRHPVCADCKLGYRVDMLMYTTGTYTEYTSLKVPVTRAMADALGRGLKRQGQAGRIVAVPSGEAVEVWS